MSFSAEKIRIATRHLRRNDAALASVIRQVGPFNLKLERNRYRMLVRSILSQQLSVGAAKSIRLRLESVAGGRITPESMTNLSESQIRSAGVSPQKTKYLIDLTARVINGDVPLSRLGRLSDEGVIAELTTIKGIGRWTAQMFLMFSLGRLDVLPTDDLGLRAAIREIYELVDMPDAEECEQISKAWRPYATIASWYCWRGLDIHRRSKVNGQEFPT